MGQMVHQNLIAKCIQRALFRSVSTVLEARGIYALVARLTPRRARLTMADKIDWSLWGRVRHARYSLVVVTLQSQEQEHHCRNITGYCITNQRSLLRAYRNLRSNCVLSERDVLISGTMQVATPEVTTTTF